MIILGEIYKQEKDQQQQHREGDQQQNRVEIVLPDLFVKTYVLHAAG